MASINQIVSEIAHAVHQSNNHVTRMTIRSAVIHTFNEQVRQSYERHGAIDKILMQRYRISIIDDPDGDIFQSLVTIKCKVKRSAQRVPRPVRLENNLPFLSVRTVGFDNLAIPFIKESSSKFYAELPGMCKLPTYDYINGYLYINSQGNPLINSLGAIVIESPFEIPTEIPIETHKGIVDNSGDDNEFVIPEDMVERIKDVIYRRNLLNVERITNEVPVKDNINQNPDIEV